MQDITVKIRTASGLTFAKIVTFDLIILDVDELVGEEIVEISIDGEHVLNYEGGVLFSEEQPFRKGSDRLIIAAELICEAIDRRGKEREMTASAEAPEPPKPGMLVEDESVVAGVDKETGETVIKPKTVEGRADESVEPTDHREA